MSINKSKNKYSILCDISESYVAIRILEKGVFGDKIVTFDNWRKSMPELNQPLTQLQLEIENNENVKTSEFLAVIDDNSIRLSHPYVAKMDGALATAFGLPAPTSLALSLKSEGLFHEPHFKIDAHWIRPGGGGIQADVIGAFIKYNGLTRRLPEPIYSLYQLSLKLTTPISEPERFALLAQLQELLPEASSESLKANGFLLETRIHYASAFSLKLGRADPFDFDPVLFNQTSRDLSPDGTMPDEAEDALLTETQQKIFIEKRFRTSEEIRSAYALRDGQYVFIDPALRPALNEVRKLQSADLKERRAFVMAPQRVLRERLGDKLSEEINLEDLFIETEQFSHRVSGVATWTKPVLPWIKPTANHWLPEKLGLKIGDEPPIEVLPADIAPLKVAVDDAISTGNASIAYGEIAIPATKQVSQALEDLLPFAIENFGFHEAGAQFEGAPKILSDKKFLIVKENFTDLEYIGFVHINQIEKIGALELPKYIRSIPKAHQIEGIDWLRRLYLSGSNGGLLADDMGLGKTFQAIAFMAWLREHLKEKSAQAKPFLIVAPTGLLANWKDEIERHLDCPWLGEVVLAFGSNLKLLREEDGFKEKDIEAGRASLQSSAWQKAGIILTTYETLRDYQFSFAKSPFELVIFDEIQKLKNPTSQLTVAAKTLNSRFNIGMTGTPVENRLQDLWSISDVLMPGLLGLSKDFDKRYPSNDLDALKHLHARLCKADEGRVPYMLRRMKSDHMPDMPSKTSHVQRTYMPPDQAKSYSYIVQKAIAGKSSLSPRDGMLQILHEMRSVSLHPLAATYIDDEYIKKSARLIWALEVLEEIKTKKEKVLIFLESLEMQDSLSQWLMTHFKLKTRPARIHGGIPGQKRQAIVREFQTSLSGFDILILSPRAGGVGLTITAANHVIHLSRWWNPAVEDQCTDRVYRIGQTKPVHVYYPLAVHKDYDDSSFDVKLNELLQRKRNLSQNLLMPPEGDTSDITQLFDSVSSPNFQNQEQTENQEPDINKNNRQTLTLKTNIVPVEIKYWNFPSGKTPDLSELFKIVKTLKLSQIIVSDPYALVNSEARSAQIQFIDLLFKTINTPFMVEIEYNPKHFEPYETDGQARKLFYDEWQKKLPEFQIPKFTCRQKTPIKDFHDRFVYLISEDISGLKRKHTLNLTRGLIGVMSQKFEFQCTYIPPNP